MLKVNLELANFELVLLLQFNKPLFTLRFNFTYFLHMLGSFRLAVLHFDLKLICFQLQLRHQLLVQHFECSLLLNNLCLQLLYRRIISLDPLGRLELGQEQKCFVLARFVLEWIILDFAYVALNLVYSLLNQVTQLAVLVVLSTIDYRV